MKTFLTHFLIAALAILGTWFAITKLNPTPSEAPAGSQKLLYYQSPMHPWVKSDEPGRCTVCGMALVPVYQGDKGYDDDAAESGIVMLPPGSPNVMGIRTSEIVKQPLVRTLRVAGMIDDDASRHRVLSAYTSGRIEKLHVNFVGAEVHAGQPLADFYSADLLSSARDYKLALSQNNPALKEGAASRLLQLGLTTEQISRIPGRADTDLTFEILAPMNGTVVQQDVYEGQYVAEGAPLFELADFSRMWFQFIAYEQDLPFLAVGQEVEITTPSAPGKTIRAEISFINPNLDDMTRSARIRVEFENPLSNRGLHRGHEILHKLYAEARVTVDAPEVLTVPRQAVLWPDKLPRVYIEQSPGNYQQRTVRLGRTGDSYYEVLDGLSPGERVVLTGNMLIDSQAQLDAMASGPIPGTPTDIPAGAVDSMALTQYFTAVDTINLALAQDDLAAANAALQNLPPVPPGLKIQTPSPAPAPDLKSLRQAFLPWSQEIANLAPGLRSQVPDLHIFRCPMTSDLWTGAPANARWVQLSDTLQNPYWGKEMQDCGAEVK